MPRKRRPSTPLAPPTPAPPAPPAPRPRIKLNLTDIASISSASTPRPSKSLAIISTLTTYPKIDMPKSKKPKIEPLVKIVSYSIEFRIYLDKVKRITQAFLVNLPISVRKTG